MSDLIPIKLAEQAIANLEAEIAQVKADLEKSDGVVWNLAVENTHLKAELTDLKSTADRFKAEVESLMTSPASRLLRAEREETARLKAEVERLQNNCDYLDQKLDEEIEKSAMLCGQVDRLTKAGDAMANALWPSIPQAVYEVTDWEKAKGVQS